MFIPGPGSKFSPSRIQGQKDSGSRIRIRIKEFKYFKFLTQKIVSVSEIRAGMFIPDPGLDFLPIPDLGVKKAPDPEHWPAVRKLYILHVQACTDVWSGTGSSRRRSRTLSRWVSRGGCSTRSSTASSLCASAPVHRDSPTHTSSTAPS
jgi:hypothetical protein